MHGLSGIIKMNAAATKVEDNHNRHCSFTGSASEGIVLHSAKLRNTVFLNPGKAAKFLLRVRKIMKGTGKSFVQDKVNHLIESYFE